MDKQINNFAAEADAPAESVSPSQATAKPPYTFRMPEVSVISSWAVRTRDDIPAIEKLELDPDGLKKQLAKTPLPGLDYALREGIELLDLYLLDNHEIPIYAGFAQLAAPWNAWKENDIKREKKHDEKQQKKYAANNDAVEEPFVSIGRFATPSAFFGSLSRAHLDNIARCLHERLVEKYKGRGIGRRPRITGIATYFPDISLPTCFGDTADRQRQNSVRALRASLYLAHRLGAHCVETVCGTWVALPSSTIKDAPEDCRTHRLTALVQSLYDVFADNPFNDNAPIPVTPNLSVPDAAPYLALEIEPGVPYLLSSAEKYTKLLEKLDAHGETVGEAAWQMVRNRVGLNADLAHFFLTGMHDPAAFRNLHKHLLHAHLSDHAGDAKIGGIHASDLVPGSFHDFFNYEPWLDVLCDKEMTPKFSGIIAIEQEASLQIEDVMAARTIVQRWLNTCSEKITQDVSPPDLQLPGLVKSVEFVEDRPHEGAFLVIDIGNSTSEFLNQKNGLERSQKETENQREDPEDPAVKAAKNWNAARTLNTVVEALCHEARRAGGSALSFTGDGLVILFEERLLPDMAAVVAAQFAQNAIDFVLGDKGYNAEQVKKEVAGKCLTLRCSLHWGTCYIPTTGTLRDNGIGQDIVYAARLCSWLGETIERAAQRNVTINQIPDQNCFIGATEDFKNKYCPQFPMIDAQWDNLWSRWGQPSFKGLPLQTVYLKKGEVSPPEQSTTSRHYRQADPA